MIKRRDKIIGPDLSVELAGLKLRNPIMPASGTFGYGEEYAPYVDLNTIGAIVTKGLSLNPKAGNDTPRICETVSGMLNAIGLQNVGIDVFLKHKMSFLEQFDTPVIVNFFGNTQEEYAELASRLDDVSGVAALEMNISCPNVKHGGIVFGTDTAAIESVVSQVRKNTSKPLIVKLTPNVTDIQTTAKAAAEAGADALSLINTLTGMSVDVKTRKPRLANTIGGLSGPAIRPVAVRLVHQVVQAVDIPVIGIGGITKAVDALEFLIVGAKAVQIGTANFSDPNAMSRILTELEDFCLEEGISDINEIIGTLDV